MAGRFRPQLLLVCLALVLWALLAAAPAAAVHGDPPPVEARAVVLMDAASGRVLHARSAETPLPMASTTKIMTALLLVENTEPDDILWVPFEARGVAGSKLYLEPGERYTARELLLALMIESANDAAVAAAVNLAGSVEAFADMMNRRASELGLTGTHFVNPHGLDASGHRTTALDLARLARAAMEHPEFREAVGALEAVISDPIRSSTRTLRSHNLFLVRYPGATGIKTGFTDEALFCLVAGARREGVELIGVILGADSDTRVAAYMEDLMDWGFTAFAPREVISASSRFTVPVAGAPGARAGEEPRTFRPAEPLVTLLPAEEEPDPDAVEWRVVGDRLEATYRGEPAGSVALIEVEDPPPDRDAAGSGDDTGRLGLTLEAAGSTAGVLGAAGVAALALTAWVRRRRRPRVRYRWRRRTGIWPGGPLA